MPGGPIPPRDAVHGDAPRIGEGTDDDQATVVYNHLTDDRVGATEAAAHGLPRRHGARARTTDESAGIVDAANRGESAASIKVALELGECRHNAVRAGAEGVPDEAVPPEDVSRRVACRARLGAAQDQI